MTIDKFFLHLLILLIPGFIGIAFNRRYKSVGKTKKSFDGWFDLLEIVALSVISAMIYDNVVLLVNGIFNQTNYKYSIS